MNDDNLKRIQIIFDHLKERIRPTLSLMQKISGHLEENIHQNLATEGEGAPIKWAPLSDAYARQKAKNKSLVQKILTASGAMDQSLFQRSSEAEAAAGTNKVYAAIHQFGGTIHQYPRSDLFLRNRYKRGKNKGSFRKGKLEADGFFYAGQSYSERFINIPARPFVYLSDHYYHLIVADIVKQITE